MSVIETAGVFAKALGSGDIETIGQLLHPDCIIHEAGGLPYAGEYRGMAGLMDLMGKMPKLLKDSSIEIKEIIGAPNGNRVAVLLELSASVAHTGKTFMMPVNEIWTFSNGKIIEIRPYYFDTHLVWSLFNEANA